MAFVFQNPDDEEQNQQQQAQAGGQPSTSPANLSQSAGASTGGPGVAATDAAAKPDATQQPSSSGTWTNLQKYLENNSGTGLGDTIASKITSDARGAQSAVSDLDKQFRSAVDKGSVSKNDELIKDAAANPQKYLSDPNLLKQFQAQRDASYGGPANLESSDGYTGAYQKTSQANQEVNQSQTEPGQFALLQQLFGRPDYTGGQQALDQILMQNDPGNREAFANLRSQYGTLGDQLSQTAQNANTYASQHARDTADTANFTKSTMTGAIGGMDSSINSRVAADQAAQAQQFAEAQKATSDPNFYTSAAFKQTGILPGNFYGVDASKYLTKEDAPTFSSVMSPTEAAKYAALNQLMDQTPESQFNQAQVGKFDPNNMVGLDGVALRQAIYTPRESDFKKQAAPLLDDQAAVARLQNWLNSPDAVNPNSPLRGTTYDYDKLYLTNQALNQVRDKIGLPEFSMAQTPATIGSYTPMFQDPGGPNIDWGNLIKIIAPIAVAA